MTWPWASPSVRSMAIPLLIFAIIDSLLVVTDQWWVGELAATVEWANGGLFLGGPVLAGLIVITVSPYLRPSFLQLTGVVGQPRAIARLTFRLWIHSLLIGVIGHGVVMVTALIITAATAPTDRIKPEAFVYGALMIVFFTTLGLAVAAFVPGILGGVAAAAIGFALNYAGVGNFLPNFTSLGGHIGSMVGVSYQADTLLSILFLTLLELVILLVVVFGRLWRNRLWAVAPISAAILLALPMTFQVGLGSNFDRLTVGQESVLQVCTGDAPEICLAQGHTRNLPAIDRALRQVFDSMKRVGMDLPTRYEERIPGVETTQKVGIIDLRGESLNGAGFSPLEYSLAGTTPRDCPEFYGTSPPTGLLQVQQALGYWLYARATGEYQVVVGAVEIKNLDENWARSAFGDLHSCKVSDEALTKLEN
jgi:hypothetical protein